MKMYYFTIASNFIFGFDKYEKTYSKNSNLKTKFKDKFFLLTESEKIIGINKSKEILKKHGKTNDFIIMIETVNNKPLFNDHKTKLGQYIKDDFINVNNVYSFKDNTFKIIKLEDLMSISYKLNSHPKHNIKTLIPRTLSILPIKIGCQAKCPFCFSKYSTSSSIEKNVLDFDKIEKYSKLSKEKGAIRGVITGGGEPTLLEEDSLIKIIQIFSKYFDNILMITNGYKYSLLNDNEILDILIKLKENGLTKIAFSRHHYDLKKNEDIMKLNIPIENILKVYNKHKNNYNLPDLRLICVIQKGGIETKKDIKNYIKWAKSIGIKDICFKELYVSSTIESEYSSYDYNLWAYEHQIELKTVIKSLKELNMKEVFKLPWGSPVFKDEDMSIAVYREPNVGWELNNNICRSWNIMSDNKCLSSLEYLDSKI